MGTAKWNNCRKPLQVCLHQGIIVWEIFVLLSDSPSAKECYVLTAPKQDFGITSEIPYGSYKWAHRSPWEHCRYARSHWEDDERQQNEWMCKKKNQPSLHMAKAVKRAEWLKKGDSAQFHKAVCYVLEGAFCKLILWRKIITNRLLKKEYCSFNGKTLGAEEVHTTKLMGHGELNAHLPLSSLLVFVFAFYPNSALDST